MISEIEAVFASAPKLSPVEQHKGEILRAIKDRDVVIVVAPTGTGKSTQIPVMLLEVAELVVVTQPRRIAAESLARHVAMELKTDVGNIVGFQTAFSGEFSSSTRILYCTDGIEMLRQLHGARNPGSTIFVIDEAHEWSLNLEVLVAWFKKQITDGNPVKLIILSATIEADLLSAFFSDAEVINCEGKSFPVQEIPHAGNAISAAVRLLKRNLNVLVFVPGKQEIRETIAGITKSGVKAKCLPFHADLNTEDIQWVFESFDEPKCVVATTIAQTSLTIPDIDAVVDGGLERGSEYKNGVEGLYTRPVSLAEREQRRGRAGRTKPGYYIDCSKIPLKERSIFSIPSIKRHELSGMVLQVLAAGYEPEKLAFFHPPSLQRINEARQTLMNIGFLDAEQRLTKMGRQATSIPVQPRAAKMLLEAVNQNGVVDYNAITLAAVFDSKNLWFRTEEGRALIAGNYLELGVSDAFEKIKTFDAASLLPVHKLTEYGIERSSFERLKEQRVLIVERLNRLGYSEGKQNRTLHAKFIVAGLSDLVFTRSAVSGDYTGIHGSTPRKLSRGSTITAEKVVGLPWNFETHTDLGPVVRRMLLWATAIPN
ncbi:hypothetical protein A3D72_03035 [Candidatus Uhrbacteria bacterium RIFCSPHIGHO2_02_FULL_57_19]|uniref:Helicase ATP-binding domain-containing protein n=2 Tax=Parcubacteria group TaxID=1794811 RepID=A0A1F6CPD1_9BACT|nr:MAG: hypothetical protein A2704_03970 [Candidatus Kaiserbacteria bacterium RIFCSPHIGHO2_01_FULL_54_36b]OGL73760.1 MAG: hypothetical protein A3D72_03035 [Candidatus Uhrbacteria bacterium RIFCSPHIGHO2_02_FULL_57_19]